MRSKILGLLDVKVRGFLLLCLSLFFVQVLRGQQEPQFSQYMFNKLSNNPAYAGSNGALCITGFYRSQWMGMKLTDISGFTPSTPTSFNVSFDMPVRFLHGGIGATLISDKIGFRSNTLLKVDYAFRIELPTGNLAFGLEPEFYNIGFQASRLTGGDQITEEGGVNASSTDPLLQGKGDVSDFLFDVGTGIYYQIPGKLYVGLSAMKLIQMESDLLYWQNRRHFYLMAGYDWTVPAHPSYRILPSVLVKTEFASYQVDLATLVEYEHRYWVGLSYRLQTSITAMAGLSIGNVKAGISYDVNISHLQNVGSLELFLRYCFRIATPPKLPTIHNNTRYM